MKNQSLQSPHIKVGYPWLKGWHFNPSTNTITFDRGAKIPARHYQYYKQYHKMGDSPTSLLWDRHDTEITLTDLVNSPRKVDGNVILRNQIGIDLSECPIEISRTLWLGNCGLKDISVIKHVKCHGLVLSNNEDILNINELPKNCRHVKFPNSCSLIDVIHLSKNLQNFYIWDDEVTAIISDGLRDKLEVLNIIEKIMSYCELHDFTPNYG